MCEESDLRKRQRELDKIKKNTCRKIGEEDAGYTSDFVTRSKY